MILLDEGKVSDPLEDKRFRGGDSSSLVSQISVLKETRPEWHAL